MNKNSFFLFLLLLSAVYVQAQQRIAVAFIPIAYDEAAVATTDAKIVQETILNSFVAAKKFVVVDREKLEDLEKEKRLQKTESFMESGASIQDGMSKGASYLISSNLLSLRNSEIKKGWEASIQLQIKVLDVSTGEILITENVNSDFIVEEKLVQEVRKKHMNKSDYKALEAHEESLQEIKKYKEDAFTLALQRLSENVKRITNNMFPVAFEIAEWNAKKKEQFLLAAGRKQGVQKGQLLDIVRVNETTVGGNSILRRQKIATGFVMNVEDENFSEATIVSTTKEFKKAIAEGGKLEILIN